MASAAEPLVQRFLPRLLKVHLAKLSTRVRVIRTNVSSPTPLNQRNRFVIGAPRS